VHSDERLVESILTRYGIVAVVGISPDPRRPSHRVAAYLVEHGYGVIPVNPNVGEVLGRVCYPDLSLIPGQVEMVDIFRRSEDVLPVVEEAIRVGARAVWMQEGVVNEEAADRAREAGLVVVMDRCMATEHSRMLARGHRRA